MIPAARLILAAGVLILAVQAAMSLTYRRQSFLPSPPPLASFPLEIADWSYSREWGIEPEALDMLAPDDILNREYTLADGIRGSVFVAYYKTQLRAKTAHDPKVCLPGSGWNPLASRVVHISLPGSRIFPANYYRIARGKDEAIVIYWFQTHRDVYTYEQELRLHRLVDSIRENRTDMALVRVTVPVGKEGVAAADARAFELAGLIYPIMLPYFPPKENNGL